MASIPVTILYLSVLTTVFSGLEKQPIQILTGHKDAVMSLAFSPDGKYLASGSRDSTIKIWSLIKNRYILRHTFQRSEKSNRKGPKNHVLSVAFSPIIINKYTYLLASSFWDSTIQFWNASSSGAALLWSPSGHDNYIWSVAFSPDGKYLASGSSDNTIKLWATDIGLRSKKPIETLNNGTGGFFCVTYSPDGKYLASGSGGINKGSIKIWSPGQEGKTPALTLEGHKGTVETISYSPDSKSLASGSRDKTIKIWNIDKISSKTEKRLIRTLNGHNDCVMSVVYSPDGVYLVSGSYDKTIKIWSATSFAMLRTLTGHKGFVRSVAYSPNGILIASGSGKNNIMIWKNPWPPKTTTTVTTVTTVTKTTASSNAKIVKQTKKTKNVAPLSKLLAKSSPKSSSKSLPLSLFNSDSEGLKTRTNIFLKTSHSVKQKSQQRHRSMHGISQKQFTLNPI